MYVCHRGKQHGKLCLSCMGATGASSMASYACHVCVPQGQAAWQAMPVMYVCHRGKQHMASDACHVCMGATGASSMASDACHVCMGQSGKRAVCPVVHAEGQAPQRELMRHRSHNGWEQVMHSTAQQDRGCLEQSHTQTFTRSSLLHPWAANNITEAAPARLCHGTTCRPQVCPMLHTRGARHARHTQPAWMPG